MGTTTTETTTTKRRRVQHRNMKIHRQQEMYGPPFLEAFQQPFVFGNNSFFNHQKYYNCLIIFYLYWVGV